jgi:hypothetical protein
MSLPLTEDLFRTASVRLGFHGCVRYVPFFDQESASITGAWDADRVAVPESRKPEATIQPVFEKS